MRRIAIVSTVALATLVTTPALAQKLTLDETKDCLRTEQQLVAEKAIIDTEGPQLARRAAELEQMRERVEALRQRVSVQAAPVEGDEYHRLRDQHYRAYEDYTADATRFNAQVTAYNEKLARYNTRCAPSNYNGEILERARRELRLR